MYGPEYFFNIFSQVAHRDSANYLQMNPNTAGEKKRVSLVKELLCPGGVPGLLLCLSKVTENI
jgi:hypothetical protein